MRARDAKLGMAVICYRFNKEGIVWGTPQKYSDSRLLYIPVMGCDGVDYKIRSDCLQPKTRRY
jgi:hypothetical protein